MRTWPCLGAALLTLAGLAGCSGNPAGPGDGARPGSITVAKPPAVAQTPVIDRIDGLSLPIEAYLPTPGQQRTMFAAMTEATNECMRSFGFAGDEITPGVADTPLLAHRYGVTDPAAAARYGYHAAPEERTGGTKQVAAGAPVSAAESLVLDGFPDDRARDAANTHNGRQVPPGGCTGEARRRTKTEALDRADPDDLVRNIAVASLKQSETDARVVEVFRKWSDCMAAAGYQYKIPVGMADDDPELAASFNSATASAKEIQLAVTDVGCKQRNNVVGVWFAVESAYQKVLIQQNQERLTQVRTALDDAARTAASIGG